jgi:Fe-S-cluster containining protein
MSEINKSEAGSRLEPIQLFNDSTFHFECRKGLSCYTACCSRIDILLTPYDVIRMKNRLKLSSVEFLALYTKPKMLKKHGLPVATLKMLDDEEERCPFVRPDGCLIYEDRPSSCRYYPVGLANLREKDKSVHDQFYFLVKEDHCVGFDEKKEWTVAEWRKDQGADVYDEVNRRWMEIVLRKRSFSSKAQLSEKSREMFFMVSYNMERLRQFVFESSFLARYDIPEDLVEKARESEVDLLQLGCEWLKCAFFGEGTIKIKEEVQGKGENAPRQEEQQSVAGNRE